MFVIALRMFRDKFKSLLIYCVSSLGLLEMYIALYPTIKQQSAMLDQVMKTMPVEMFKAMNMDPASFSFSTLEAYLSTEYMSFLWPIIAIIFAISLANYIAVREIDKGTIEILCSLPVGRTKLFISRYIAGLKMLAIFCLISLLGVVPFAKLHGLDYSLGNYLTASLGSFLFIWGVYSLGTFISVLFSEKGKSTMVTSGVVLLMYVINVIAGLNDKISDIKYFSFFHYFNGTQLLNKNSLVAGSIVFFISIALIFTISAVIRFNRRDLSV